MPLGSSLLPARPASATTPTHERPASLVELACRSRAARRSWSRRRPVSRGSVVSNTSALMTRCRWSARANGAGSDALSRSTAEENPITSRRYSPVRKWPHQISARPGRKESPVGRELRAGGEYAGEADEQRAAVVAQRFKGLRQRHRACFTVGAF